MTITNITRFEFDRILPRDATVENPAAEPVAWFSNESENLLGTVVKGEGMANWNHVILKRDKEGSFHVYQVMHYFVSLKAASTDLQISMAQVAIEEPELAIPLAYASTTH